MDGKPYYNAHMRLDMVVDLKDSKLRASVSFKGQQLVYKDIDLYMKDEEEITPDSPTFTTAQIYDGT